MIGEAVIGRAVTTFGPSVLATDRAVVALARPAGSWTFLAVVAAAVAFVWWRHVAIASRPPRPVEIGRARPRAADDGRLEPPAVVGLVTNGYRVPTSAATATVLDLARRDWIRLAWTDAGEVVVLARGTGRSGDHLAPFEQQVLNHLTARSFDGMVTAATLAAPRSRPDGRWWRRFRRDVVRTARRDGLTRPRWRPEQLAGPAAAAIVAIGSAWLAWSARTHDTSFRDDPVVRVLWAATLVVVVTGVVRAIRTVRDETEHPTEAGERRAGQWLGHRRHLADLIPERASVVTSPEQQLALAHATVLGVPTQAADQLPIVEVDARRAWSEAGGSPHVVSVRYPFRPGYGRTPWLLALVGAVVVAVSQAVQRFLHRVEDREALDGLTGTFPDWQDRLLGAVGVIADLWWIPTLWGLWAVVSGAVDLVAIRRRTGLVVRVRRPVDVAPRSRWLRRLARRDRFASFVAVDDGRRDRITAWLADERRAVPEGVHASVRATPLLGHVRSADPTGTSTAPPS